MFNDNDLIFMEDITISLTSFFTILKFNTDENIKVLFKKKLLKTHLHVNSHVVPLVRVGQLQVKLFPLGMQVPPKRQGLESQGPTSGGT